MKIHCALLLLLVAYVARPCMAGGSLREGGMHVKTKVYTYNSYRYYVWTYTTTESYKTCCCSIFGLCISHCMKRRTLTVYKTVSQLLYRNGKSNFCERGWAVRSNGESECLLAICNPACRNGNCDKPGHCTCHDGFNGEYCEFDINECNHYPSPCEQSCTNLWGSYSCSCGRGFLKASKSQTEKKCTDIDECKVVQEHKQKGTKELCQCVDNLQNSTCVATCQNTLGSYKCRCNKGFHLVANKVCTATDQCAAGTYKCAQVCWTGARGVGYKCSCRPGYNLAADGFGCNDLNECYYSNGGCEQNCTNTEGSFKCSCGTGFIMNAKMQCEDINECLISRPCDNFNGVCMNRWGTYECGCQLGYELEKAGSVNCIDINECERMDEGKDYCNQNCSNTEGSYFCTCEYGYKLGVDGKTCQDIDECREGISRCTHICDNTEGSYRCECPPGHFLGDDGYTCIGEPCKTLYSPHRGSISCTGFNVNDRCTFKCNAGYAIHGTAMKTCQKMSRWSSGMTECVPQTCALARPPRYGILIQPCVEEYGSKCFLKCQHRYHMHGDPFMKCKLEKGKTKWFQETTCKEIKLCTPNPCLHKGRCITLSETQYTCDCSNTGYRGKKCKTGIVTIPEFPQMKEGEESEEFYIRAKPDNFINIKLTTDVNNSVSFYPSDTLSLYAPREKVMFKMTPKRKGLIKIRYTLFGKDSFTFDQPRANIIYVFPKEDKKRLSNIPDEKFMKGGRNHLFVDRCLNGRKIFLSSTCKWKATGTFGFVNVNSIGISAPLSLYGVTFAASERIRKFSSKGVLSVAKITQEMLVGGPRPCKGQGYTEADIEFILKRNNFLRTYFSSVSDTNPWWIEFGLPGDYEGFHANDIQSTILRGERMNDLRSTSCPNIPSELRGTYSTLVTRSPISIDLMGQSTKFESVFHTCVTLNLCGHFTYVSLPAHQHLDLNPHVSSLLEVKVKGFGFSPHKVHEEICVQIKDNPFCVKPKLWSRADMGFRGYNAELQFQGEIFSEPKDLDSMFIERFNMEHKTYMKGSLSGSISVQVHGKKLNLISTDQQATVVAHVGGAKERCMAATTRGIHLFMNPSAVAIDYETSALRLYPKLEGTTFRSHIQYGLQYGHVLSVDGLARLKLQVRKAGEPLDRLRMLQRSVRSHRAKYELELRQLEKTSANYKRAQKNAKRKVKRKSSKYKDIFVEVAKLKKESTFFIDSLIALKDAVLMTETSQSDVAKHVSKYGGIMVNQLKLLSRMTMKPKLSQLLERNEGLSVSYFGGVCVHGLCFSNNNISISDLKDGEGCSNKWDATMLSENIYITATSEKVRKLGPYFMVPRNAKVEILMSKKSKSFFITLPVTVTLFNKTVNTSLRINEDRFEFHVDRLSIGNGSDFDVVAFAKFSLTSTWDSIFFYYKGNASTSSSLESSLETITEEMVTSVAKKTTKRFRDAANKLKRSQDLVKKYSKKVVSLREDFTKKDRERRRANATYLKADANFKAERERFHSEVRAGRLRDISKTLDAECKQITCHAICTPVTIYDICQKKVTGKVNEITCHHDKKITRSTVEDATTRTGDSILTSSQGSYSGSCGKEAQQALKSSLAQSGASAALGAAVGGVVGSSIGAGVGAVASMFSSCDESYKTCAQLGNTVGQFLKRVTRLHIQTVVVTTCYPVQHTTVKGFSIPETCQVGNSSCIRTTDSQCLKKNNDCLKRRGVVRKKILEALNVTREVWLNMERYEIKVAGLFPKVLQARNTALEAKRKYQRAVAHLNQAKVNAGFAKLTIEKINSSLPLKRCFLRLDNERKPGESILYYHDMHFQTENPHAENILVELSVNTKGAHPQTSQFLYVFQDQQFSIKHGVRNILKINLCGGILRQYSSILSNSARNTLSFHMDHSSSAMFSSTEAKESDYVCKSSQTIFSYIEDVAEKLKNITVNTLMQKDEATTALLNIERVINNLRKESSDSVVKEELKMMEDAKARKSDQLQELHVANMLLRWHQNMELFTKGYNFTDCLNAKDCIETAIENLHQLPSMIKVDRSAYAMEIHKLETNFDKIFSKVVPAHLDALKQLAAELKESLTLLKGMTSFCARVPDVRLTSPPIVVAFNGDVVELKCLSSSDLPVSYSWKHNNKTLLSENQSKLRIFIQNSTTGSYVCDSWNRVGRSSSNETYIALRKKPVFLQQPKDFSFLSTVATNIRPFFVCNVTSDPFPKISWYYHPFHQPNKVLKLHFTKPVLNIDKPTVASNGFYYCVATNTHGSATSKKVRLDVLLGEVPQQQLSVAFDFPLSRFLVEKKKYGERMKNDSEVKKQQSLGIQMEDAGTKAVKIDVKIDDISDTNAYGMQDGDLLRRVAHSRSSLSEVIQRIVSGMVYTHARHFGVEMERTMMLGFDGRSCSDGYSLHGNGFTCAPCVAGSYEFAGYCVKCPVGAYQPYSGQSNCTSCNTAQVTAESGSTTHHECQTPVFHSMDIIVVLDSSTSLSTEEFSKVRLFLSKFVKEFIGKGTDLKFGLISFNSQADYVIELSRYGSDVSSLTKKIDGIQQSGSGIRRSEAALHLATKILRKNGVSSRRKVVISLISGSTTGDHGIKGFDVLRNASLSLHLIGIQSVATGIGPHIDQDELLALASMPKENNIIKFRNADEILTSGETVAANALKGQCGFSGKDIALAIESSEAVDETSWSNAMHFVQAFMQKFVKENFVKFGLSSYGSKILPSHFKYFTSMDDITAAVSQLVRVKDRVNIPKTLNYLYNSYVTEKFESYFDKKIIILFSMEQVKDEVLASVNQGFYDEDVKFLNVVMSLHKQEAGVSDIGVEESMKSVYSLSAATDLADRVKRLRSNREEQCLY